MTFEENRNAMRHLMANMPSDIGRKVIAQIMSTPRVDEAKMRDEAERLEREMLRVRELETKAVQPPDE